MAEKIEMMKPKPHVSFTAERKERFLELFRERGVLYVCADMVGVTGHTVINHRRSDPEFGIAYKEAREHYTDNVIIRALTDRGVDGVEEPIIGGKERDVVVAHKRVYSDACLLALARAQRQELGQKGAEAGEEGSGSGGGSGGGVLIVPAAPHSIQAWQEQFGVDARGGT